MSRSIKRDVLARLEPHEHSAGKTHRVKNYIDPYTGNVYTQYQVQKAKNHGLAPATVAEMKRAGTWSLAQKLGKRGEHLDNLVNEFRRTERKRGERVTTKQIVSDRKFWRTMKGLWSKDRSAHGPLAKALELLGVRERGAKYPVGQSPKKRDLQGRKGRAA